MSLKPIWLKLMERRAISKIDIEGYEKIWPQLQADIKAKKVFDERDIRILYQVHVGGLVGGHVSSYTLTPFLTDLLRRGLLQGANLSEAYHDTWRLSLPGAPLAEIDFFGGHFRNCDFEGADLSKTIFTEANIRDTQFLGANLKGARFEQTTMLRARFSDKGSNRAKNTEGLQFSGSNITSCDFSQCFLKGASFRAATIETAPFLGTRLQGADFFKAQFGGDAVIFVKADLRGATFEGAKTTATMMMLDNADLRGANFKNFDWTRCTLDGADLRDLKTSVSWPFPGAAGTPKFLPDGSPGTKATP